MVSLLVLSLIGIWTLLAFVVAVMAKRKGLSFLEFFAYGLLALPFAFLSVKTFGGRQDPDGVSAESDRGRVLPRPAGLTALRAATLVFFLMIAAGVAQAPGHFVANLEAVAQASHAADDCVARDSFSNCVPTKPISLIGEVVASTLPVNWRMWDADTDYAVNPSLTPAPSLVELAAAQPVIQAATEGRAIVRAPARTPALENGEALDPAVAPKSTGEARVNEAETGADEAETDQASAQTATREHIRAAQQSLRTLGFRPGPVDGIFGQRTARAIEQFQSENGLAVTGEVSEKLLAILENRAETVARIRQEQRDAIVEAPVAYNAPAPTQAAVFERRASADPVVIRAPQRPAAIQRRAPTRLMPAGNGPIRLTAY